MKSGGGDGKDGGICVYLVNVDHEVVEVDASLALDGPRRVEQVHDEGLAAARAAPHVQSSYQR